MNKILVNYADRRTLQLKWGDCIKPYCSPSGLESLAAQLPGNANIGRTS